MMKAPSIRRIMALVVFACTTLATPLHAGERSVVRGGSDAPVTIMVFSAFTCPFCADARKQIDALQAKYPGKLAIVYKHLPLGSGAPTLPHEAALAAAEQGKFWEMHDTLYDHHGAIGHEAQVVALARRLKLDMPRFQRALAQHAGAARLADDEAEARALHVTGTPTFYIGGYKLEGKQELSALELMVVHQLGALAQPTAAGVKGTP